MFPRIITRYGLAAHLALLASLPFVLFPFLSESTLAEVIFWLSGLAFLWLLTEPSMRAGEHLSTARRRVLGSLVRDIAFWFFLCVLVVAFIRYVNSDVNAVYSLEEGKWNISEPSYPSLPASTSVRTQWCPFPTKGLLSLAVLTGMSVVVLGIRHGIGLTGRISFGLISSLIMGIGGLTMVVCACLQVPSFMCAAKADFLGGPFWRPFWGPGFGVWLICALAFGTQAEARKWGAARVPFCLAIAGNASGLLFFSPPPVSSVFLVVASLAAIFCLAYLGRAGSMGASARGFVFMLLGFSAPFFFLFALVPDEVEFDNCVQQVDSAIQTVKEPTRNIYAVKAGGFLAVDKDQAEIYGELSPKLSEIAKGIWKKHLWYGAGTGTFPLYFAVDTPPKDQILFQKAPFISKIGELQSFKRVKVGNDWRTRLIMQQMKDAAKALDEKGKQTVKHVGPEMDWTAIRQFHSPDCAFNSYWTFLAERGLLGVALAVLGLGILLVTYIVRFVLAVQYLRTQDDSDVFLFACPPIVWVTPFALALLFVLARYEPVFDIVPMFLVGTVPLAIAAASFPKKPTPRNKAVQSTLEGESH